MCVVCGKPATSPYVDRRFCHFCGLAFELGRSQAASQPGS
jgi:hypothetical protein